MCVEGTTRQPCVKKNQKPSEIRKNTGLSVTACNIFSQKMANIFDVNQLFIKFDSLDPEHHFLEITMSHYIKKKKISIRMGRTLKLQKIKI